MTPQGKASGCDDVRLPDRPRRSRTCRPSLTDHDRMLRQKISQAGFARLARSRLLVILDAIADEVGDVVARVLVLLQEGVVVSCRIVLDLDLVLGGDALAAGRLVVGLLEADELGVLDLVAFGLFRDRDRKSTRLN